MKEYFRKRSLPTVLGTDGAEEWDASGERCRWETVRKLAGLPSPSRTEGKTKDVK